MKQSLGRGISGSVDLGVHKDSGEKYALKQIKVYNKSGRFVSDITLVLGDSLVYLCAFSRAHSFAL